MTAVIQKLYASRARFHAKATQINQFVRVHDIDGDLKKRIEDWFISHWSISKGVNTEEVRTGQTNRLVYKSTKIFQMLKYIVIYLQNRF